MKKVLLIIIIIIITGCTNNSKFYLTDKYYNNGEMISVSPSDINSHESFILYTYNNFCALPIHCENIFKEVLEKNKIDALSIPFEDFKETSFYKKVKYAPSVLLIKDGKIIDYLKADSDEDYDKYQKVDVFQEWLEKYIYLNKKQSN